jgi:hypothetical protein
MLEVEQMSATAAESGIQELVALDPESGTWCTADVAECTCPEFCERDHDNE